MDWIDLAQNRDQFGEDALVSTVTSHQFPLEILEQLSDWQLLKKNSGPWN
jgi:hypothetical protein